MSGAPQHESEPKWSRPSQTQSNPIQHHATQFNHVLVLHQPLLLHLHLLHLALHLCSVCTLYVHIASASARASASVHSLPLHANASAVFAVASAIVAFVDSSSAGVMVGEVIFVFMVTRKLPLSMFMVDSSVPSSIV